MRKRFGTTAVRAASRPDSGRSGSTLDWSRRAERQAARGNFAGAAIRRARAEQWAPRERAAEAATRLREEIERLVDRLQSALGIEGDDPRPWRESLLALAHQSPRRPVDRRGPLALRPAKGVHRPRAADVHDRRHALGLVVWPPGDPPRPARPAAGGHVAAFAAAPSGGWPACGFPIGSGGSWPTCSARRPRRPRPVSREDLRPKIAATLDAIDLRPRNLPEEVSRRKIVEELLDRIVERGFLTLGEVRDAISRNNLKEPDCSGPRSFLRGEAALRANRRLTDALDGVYEPADFYLRWILRFSHLMFGTAAGRFLTLFFIIPYGGPFAVFMTLDHLMGLVGVHPHLVSVHGRIANFVPLVASGVFLQLLIYVPWLRRAVWHALNLLGRAVRFLFVDALQWFIALRWINIILHSQATRLIVNLVVKPIVPTLIVARFIPADTAAWRRLAGLAVIYAGLLIVLNSRVGRTLEEMVLDGISEGWQRFGVRPLVGLFWFTIDLFRRLLQGIERVLYTVDEWLRFRSGQGRAMLIAKAVMGVAWFFVAYFVRFVVNLLIEPQVNPLKHFPWVTAAHKMMWPLFLSSGLNEFLASRLGAPVGDTLFFAIGTAAPGIVGFLIWEFKENWRLFAANRPKNLRPAIIGTHGETMPRLLRPGIHSGTIPKRFAKLRRAERKALCRRRSGRGPQAPRGPAPRGNRIAALYRARVPRLVRRLLRMDRAVPEGGRGRIGDE